AFLAQFFARNARLLQNAFIVLLGDHGPRFGKSLLTYQGRVENAMPSVQIYLPPSMINHYPHLSDYLESNKYRLITHLDIFQMLLDLSRCDLQPKAAISNYQENMNQGTDQQSTSTQAAAFSYARYSLFRETVPNDRSCESARIPSSYCFCKQ